MNGKLWKAAVHEAGHATVAASLGEDVWSCRVAENADGCVAGETTAFARSPFYTLAGIAAEEVVFGSRGEGYHKDLEDHRKGFWQQRPGGDEHDLEYRWQTALQSDLEKAKAIVRRNESVLRMLAHALLMAPVQKQASDGLDWEIRELNRWDLLEILNQVNATAIL